MLLRGAGPKALIGREIVQNDRISLLTAGTAYSMLQRDLRKVLKLLPAPTRPAAGAQEPPPSEESNTDV
jgi:hypothetical protein